MRPLLKQKRKELHGFVGQAIEKLYMDRLEEFCEMLSIIGEQKIGPVPTGIIGRPV
jgi:hypothetical protein